MASRYTLSQLNADSALAGRVRELVFTIVGGTCTTVDTKECRTAVAIINAKRRSGQSVCRTKAPAKFE